LHDIKPIKLDRDTIRSLGSKASRLYGYKIQDVGTITLEMNSLIGITFKEKLFGQTTSLAPITAPGATNFAEVFTKLFADSTLHTNYKIGDIIIDYYVPEFNLVLYCTDCNGQRPVIPYTKLQQLFPTQHIVQFQQHNDITQVFNAILKTQVNPELSTVIPEPQAIYYGTAEIVPGLICDCYVLDDGRAVLSERGAADLLGVEHRALQSMANNSLPYELKSFLDKDFSVVTNLANVTAENSPYVGRKIRVYNALDIIKLMRAYAVALTRNALKETQTHIGYKSIINIRFLTHADIEIIIREACGLPVSIAKTIEKTRPNIVTLMSNLGLNCIENGKMVLKKDIIAFMHVPLSTLNTYLKKRCRDIQPIKLDRTTIKKLGSKAVQMNAYTVQDVGTIVLGMKSEVGEQLKTQMFGQVGTVANIETTSEIEWWQKLKASCADLSLFHHYHIDKSRIEVDFYLHELELILECNGYDGHASYDPIAEKKREQLFKNYRVIRFIIKSMSPPYFELYYKSKKVKSCGCTLHNTAKHHTPSTRK